MDVVLRCDASSQAVAIAELSSLASCFVERAALLAGVRRREPDDVLAVGKPKMQPAAAEEQAEQPPAPSAAPFAVLVVSPPHEVPLATSANT